MANIEKGGQLYFWRGLVTKERDEDSLSLYNIPSDDGSRFTLSLTVHAGVIGDVFITMHDSSSGDDGWIHFDTLRLRGRIGGGMNPFITEEFMSVIDGIGKTEFKFETPSARTKDRINSNSRFVIQQDEKVKLGVLGIQDDDGEDVFMDILTLKNGDALLRFVGHRLVGRETEEVVGEMLFKTRKNGGQNPIMAETLTRITKRIARAKR